MSVLWSIQRVPIDGQPGCFQYFIMTSNATVSGATALMHPCGYLRVDRLLEVKLLCERVNASVVLVDTIIFEDCIVITPTSR